MGNDYHSIKIHTRKWGKIERIFKEENGGLGIFKVGILNTAKGLVINYWGGGL